MIDNQERLEAYIRLRLSEGDHCRVFDEMLENCWSIPRDQQEKEIATFADQRGWEVKIHKPGNLGRVADFSRR